MKTEKDFLEYLKPIRQAAAEQGFASLDETFTEHLRCRFFGRDVIIGQTKRLLIREIRILDLEAFYGFEDAKTEPVLKAFLKETREESAHFLQDYIAHMYPLYDYGIWTVEKAADGEVIGLCGLGRVEISGEAAVDLGYYIRPKCRKQGYAAESIEIVLDYVKNYLEIPVICAIIKEENRISAKVLQKFGFRNTGKQDADGNPVYEKELTEKGNGNG